MDLERERDTYSYHEVINFMCLHGTYKWVSVINCNSRVKVDACIADEIQMLNDLGIITLGSCCGHGEAGMPVEWENDFGRWKGYVQPPHVLIDEKSKNLAELLGYRPFPYYYADGEYSGVMQMYLKTGCLTKQDCVEWKEGRDVALPLD